MMTMKFSLALCLFAFASCASVVHNSVQEAPAGAATPSTKAVHENRVSIYLGQRGFDEDDYAPVEDQATFGFEFAHETVGSAVGFEVGLLGSSDESSAAGFDVEGSSGELYAGVRKTFGEGVARPYLGGGLSFIHSEFEVSGFGSDDDQSAALYVHGGVLFDVSESFFVGLDLRLLLGSDLEIAGVETDADYSQFALVAGVSF